MSNWRSSRDYKVWRAHVIRRDRCCVICGCMERRHAHHLLHATYFPDDRYNEDCGVCLCSMCHTTFHCSYLRSYRQKCDMNDWLNFLETCERLQLAWARERLEMVEKRTSRLRDNLVRASRLRD